MTRWARTKSALVNKKLPEEATPWSEFVSQRKEFKSATPKKQNNTSASSLQETGEKKQRVSNTDTEISLKEKLIASKKKKLVEEKESPKGLKRNSKAKKRKATVNSSVEDDEMKDAFLSDSASTGDIQENEDSVIKDCKKKKKRHGKIHSPEKAAQDDSTVSTDKSLEDTKEKEKEAKSNSKERRKKMRIERLMQQRQDNGILLLPPHIEKYIYQLKSMMRKHGVCDEEIRDVVRKVRREEELKYRKQLQKTCFKCRKPGHLLADCPEIKSSLKEAADICFKCGSTEHRMKRCTVQTASKIEVPYASCFICKKQGHLARSCPENKHGVYPKGGHCNFCGSINHRKMECQELERNKKKEVGETEVTAEVADTGASADAEPLGTLNTSFSRKVPKVVIF